VVNRGIVTQRTAEETDAGAMDGVYRRERICASWLDAAEPFLATDERFKKRATVPKKAGTSIDRAI
jgi:hypothetical protein